MTTTTDQVEKPELDVEQMELSLGMFEIQLEQKLKQLRQQFSQPSFQIDLTKLYYDHVGSTELKFKELMALLQTLLIKEEQSTTPNLRSTFFRVLENPLFALFKTSKFQLFDLSLNGFDIEIEPLEALKEVHARLVVRISEYKKLLDGGVQVDLAELDRKLFRSEQALLLYSLLHSIEFKIFTLYSYLRKGSQLLRKTFESRLAVTEMFNVIEKELAPLFVRQSFVRGLKEVSTLNFEIYNIEPTYDYFFFYFSVPLASKFLPVFLDINIIAERCHRNNNYNPFVQFFLKHHRGLRDRLQSVVLGEQWVPHINTMLAGALRLLRAEVLLFQEFVQVVQMLLLQSQRHPSVLEGFLKFQADKDTQSLRDIHSHYAQIVKAQPQLVSTLRAVSFERVREKLEAVQRSCLYGLDYTALPIAKVQELHEIMGGMPSSYFEYVEGRLKQLNPTVSITNKHKYIASQFNVVEVEKLAQGIREINNFMVLSEAYPKEYDQLFESKLNPRYFFDLLGLVIDNSKELEGKSGVEMFVGNVFKLFQKVKLLKDGISQLEQIKYYRTLSKAASVLADPLKHQTFCGALLAELSKDRANMTIKDYIGLAGNLHSKDFDAVDELISTLLSELHIINQKVTKHRFHEMALEAAANEVLTEDEAKYIRDNFEIVNEELVAKDVGIFKLSNQDQTTNPLNLDSRIDQVYLSLTANTKRVLQITVLELLLEVYQHVEEAKPAEVFHSRSNFILSMLAKSCKEYPVVVPYLMSLKVNLRDIKAALAAKNSDIVSLLPDSATFAEFLTFSNVMDLHACRDLLQQVLHRKEIKYINGHDYVRQEIATAVMEASVKLTNHLRAKNITGDSITSSLDLLVSTIEIQRKLTKAHIDIVRSLVEISKQLISKTSSLHNMFQLSHVYRRLVALYFRGKEQELRNGISKQYHLHRLEPIRNFDPKESSQISIDKVDKLSCQTSLTFGVNFDFEIENSILDKSSHTPPIEKRTVPFHHIRKHLSASEKYSPVKHQQHEPAEPLKELDLSKGKLNMLFHLGEANVRKIADKSGFVFKFGHGNTFPTSEDATLRAHELQNIALFYLKDVAFPPIKEELVEEAILAILVSDKPLQFMRNSATFGKIVDLLSIVLLKDKWQFSGDSSLAKYLQSMEGSKEKQAVIDRILQVFSHFGYSNLWVCCYDDLAALRLRQADIWLKDSKLPTKESLLCLFLKSTLNKYVEKELADFKEHSHFLKEFFEKRPQSNTALTYKIPVDKQLLNLMLKCIDFQHLHYASILFYANFENLRLYTQDIQEGFKALNLASKTRSYNEFLKLSKEYNDLEYLNPLRIFKENLKFFVKVEREGYEFKRREELAIATDKLVSTLKSHPKDPAAEVDKVLEAYLLEVGKLKVNTVNRVKTMYLASKLRDLSIQNGQTISLLYEILSSGGLAKDKLLAEVSKVQIFSILALLQYELLQFQQSSVNTGKYGVYSTVDSKYLSESLTYPTTRRFGFNMSHPMQKCELEFDDVLQQALVQAKIFLTSSVGREWATENLRINPAFFTENLISNEHRRSQLIDTIRKSVERPTSSPTRVSVRTQTLFEDLNSQLDSLPPSSLLSAGLDVQIDGKKVGVDVLTQQLAGLLISRQILIKAGKYLVFNRYKFSEDSLDLIQLLGSLLAICLYRGLRIDLPLHNSLISLIRSSMTDLDDLVDVDFKTWEGLKAVLAEADSKTLNLTFSYEFDSAREPGKKERLQLIDKGTSKKVNNLNREEYCDLICCRILYGFCQLQLDRFMIGLYHSLPKEFFENSPALTVLRTLYRQDQPEIEKAIRLHQLKKFGLIYPELFIGKEHSFQNLKDFVNINWLLSLLADLPFDRLKKFAALIGSDVDFLSLKVYTRTGAQEALELLPEQKIVITHFSSRERMQAELTRLIGQ